MTRLSLSVTVKLHRNDKIRRMSRRRQNTTSIWSLIDWTTVGMSRLHLITSHRPQPNQRHWIVENTRLRLLQTQLRPIPSGSFQEQSVHHHTVLRWHIDTFDPLNFVVEHEKVDGNGILSSIVLLRSSEKCLRKVETRKPKACRRSIFHPIGQKLQSCQKVAYVTSQRLEARIWFLLPHRGYFTCCHGCNNLLDVGRDGDEAFERFDGCYQTISDTAQQHIEPTYFLHQHRVHALLVARWILSGRLVNAEVGRQLAKYIVGNLHDDSFDTWQWWAAWRCLWVWDEWNVLILVLWAREEEEM